MNKFKIASINCNGIADSLKRKDVFDKIRQYDCNIYLLQETHLKETDETFIRTGWGYQVILAGNSSNTGGTAILFKNNFEYSVGRVEKDENGKYIILELNCTEKKYILVNIYGPSSGDNETFFEKINDLLKDYDEGNIIIGGDFNCVLDLEKDRKNCTTNNNRPRTRRQILNMMANYNLLDIFRMLNPDKNTFTWRKFNSNKQSRLDYFLVSEDLLNDIKEVETKSKYKSDHSPVILSINKNNFQRDRTFWKFNNSLLYDKNYVQLVKQTINAVKKQYCNLIYNTDKIDEVPLDEVGFRIEDDLLLEVILMEIRGKSIAFSSNKKREDNKREKDIEKEIQTLEQDNIDTHYKQIDDLRAELETLRDKRIQGMAVRSKSNWIHQGEKVNKYFLNLESRNYKEKMLPFIETSTGEIISEQSKIKEEVMNFYKNLYGKREVIDCNFENINNAKKLQDEDRLLLEGYISLEEVKEAVKNLSSNKSPGPDGFTSEFFKFFILDLGTFIVRAANTGFIKEQLSPTFRQGNIILIPKDNKPKRFIKNLRPISLLSTVYKIVSTCVANRLKGVLPSIIGETQHAFLKSRNISSNIRFIYDTLVYTEENNLPGMILSVDFEKAFDSIAWSFLLKTLEFFNFGPQFTQWVRTLYSNIKSCISINGQYSEWFEIQRGVRQGDPSSPYLYLICAEVLSLMIKSNDKIKGIQMQNNINLLSQFADDTTLSLDGTEQSLTEALDTIAAFSRFSGLKMNEEKTMIVWIGSTKGSNHKYLRNKNYVWDPGTCFKIVGINFSTNIPTIPSLNYESKLDEMKRILYKWKKTQNITLWQNCNNKIFSNIENHEPHS